MNLKGKKINFLGDSITEGAVASCIENRYTDLVAKMLEVDVMRNYGIGGTRIARQDQPSEVAIYDRDFCLRVHEMDDDADAVVVFGGTNDYGHGLAPLGTFADRTPYTFYGACHYLMSTLVQKYPGKPIVFLTPLHRLGDDQPSNENGKTGGVALIHYVNIIKEVAAYYSLPILDMYAISGLQPNLPIIQEKFMNDGLHPNDEGHAILAERIANFLLAL